MKNLFLILIAILAMGTAKAQYYRITNDSILAHSELILENSSKDKTGAFIQNVGNGRTQFAYAVDSGFIRHDTIFQRLGNGWLYLKLPPGNSGAPSGSDSTYVTFVNYYNNILTVGRNGLPNLTTTIPLSGKVSTTDTANMLFAYKKAIVKVNYNATTNATTYSRMDGTDTTIAGIVAGFGLKYSGGKLVVDSAILSNSLLEKDSIFLHSAAATITAPRIVHWDSSYRSVRFDTTTRMLWLKRAWNDSTKLLIPGGNGGGVSVEQDPLSIHTADSAAMLAPYQLKGNYVINETDPASVHLADTAIMLSPYQLKYQEATQLNLKVNLSDTSTMLSPYLRSLNASATYQPKGNYLTSYTETDPLAVKKTDSSAMLSPYLRSLNASQTYVTSAQIAGKVNTSDTATMLNPYLRSLNASATYQPKGNYLSSYTETDPLSVHTADSASMLSPYLRKLDTTGKWQYKGSYVPTARTITINGTTYDLSSDRSWTIATSTGSVPWGNITGTLSAQIDLQNALNAKVNTSDTATMLNPYLRSLNASQTYQPKGNYLSSYTETDPLSVHLADSANMLNPYLRSLNASATYQPKGNYLTSYTETDPLAVKKTDSSAMLSPYLRSLNASQTYVTAAQISGKVNTSDTATMLSPYLRSLNASQTYQPKGNYLSSYTETDPLSVHITDSANMLNPYLRSLNASATYQPKGNYLTSYTETDPLAVKKTDSSAMLSPYLRSLNASQTYVTAAQIAGKVNTSDTATMLNPYLRSLNASATYQAKGNYLTSYTETDPSSVHITDSANMLNPYLRSLNASATYQPKGSYLTSYTETDPLAVKKTDSSAMLSPYLRSLNASQTYVTSAQIAGKVNTSDTATMLNPYLRSLNASATYQPKGNYLSSYTETDPLSVHITDSANMLNPYLRSLNASASYQPKGSYLTSYTETDPLAVKKTDSSAMLSPYLRSLNASQLYATTAQLNGKVNTSDTATMLNPYLRSLNASAIYQPKGNYLSSYTETDPLSVHITDSANMLNPYLRSLNASATYQPKGSYLTSYTETDPLAVKKTDSSAMLSPYLRSLNASQLYATTTQLNSKVNTSDTATMLSPYLKTATANQSYVAVGTPLSVTTVTLAQLRASTGNTYNKIYQISDYGGGQFQITAPSDNTLNDNTGTLVITADGWVAKRIYSGNASVTWFGLVGDGVTDNKAAFIKAINSGVKVIEFPSTGIFYFSGTIDVKTPIRITGQANWMATAYPVVMFASGVDGFIFHRYNTPIGTSTDNTSDGSEIDHIVIKQTSPYTRGHGIWAHCRINAHDLSIENWGGDGIHIDADFSDASMYRKLNRVLINQRGSSYTSTPTVTITGDGTGAAVHAVLGGWVSSISLTNGGNYDTKPYVKLFDSQSYPATGFGATYEPSMGITSPTIVSGGTGYTTASITITGDGTGATATPVLSGGAITGVTITNPGSGYTVPPTFNISGNGTGAQITSLLTVVSLTATSYGGDYEVTPTVYFGGGIQGKATGGAAATATVSNYTVKRVEVDNQGSNYTYGSITISGGGGSGAYATPWFFADIQGNANNWKVQNSRIVNCANGLYVSGGDGNAGYAIGLDLTSNRLNGIWDNSFLGNKYIMCHTANNALHPYLVSQDASITDFDNCYSEGGQFPSFGLAGVTFRGGDHGALIDDRGGSKIEGAINNKINFTSVGTKDVIEVGIGVEPDLGTIEKIKNTAIPVGGEVRRKIDRETGDLYMEASNYAPYRWNYLTNLSTRTKFGRNNTVPFASYVDQLFVGEGRQITSSISFPPAKKTTQTEWAQGDFVFNAAPTSAAGVIGWSRLTTGSADVLGTDWLEVKSGSSAASPSTLDQVLTVGNTSTQSAGFGSLQVGTSGTGWNISPIEISGRYGTGNASKTRLKNYYGDAGGNLSYLSNNLSFNGGWYSDDNTTSGVVMFLGGYSGGPGNGFLFGYNPVSGSSPIPTMFYRGGDGTLRLAKENYGGEFASLIPNAVFGVRSFSISQVAFKIESLSGQTANLQEWSNSSQQLLAAIAPTGNVVTVPATASNHAVTLKQLSDSLSARIAAGSGGSGGVAGVTSFNSRTGAVVPQLSDYSAYFAALSHTHSAADITTGNLTSAVIATGTPTVGYIPKIQSDGSVQWNADNAGSSSTIASPNNVQTGSDVLLSVSNNILTLATPNVSASARGVVPASGTASGRVLKDDGTWGNAGYYQTVVITSGTSYTPSTGVTKIRFRMVGGGGSGGGVSGTASQAAAASGGGSGGYLEKTIAVTAGTPYTIQIGAGGAAGTAGANAGNPGTATTIIIGATTYTANFGGAGQPMATGTTLLVATPGAGAAVSVSGDVNAAGQPGTAGMRLSASVSISGNGAPSALGGGGLGINSASSAGNPGLGYGSGGSGAANIGNSNQSGGAGKAGVLIIDEFK